MRRPTTVRAVLAMVLVGSSVLFVFATRAERGREHAETHTALNVRTAPPVTEPTTAPSASSAVSAAPTTPVAPARTAGARGDPDGGEHPPPAFASGSAPSTTGEASSPKAAAETPTTTAATEFGGSETAGQHIDARHPGSRTTAEKAETLLGVKTESVATTAAVVVLSLVAAAAALAIAPRWLWAIVAFGSVLAVLDGREAAHQASLGRGSLEAFAIVVLVAHGVAAVLAAWAARGRQTQPSVDPVAS